jgi:hypothetical protein
MTKTTMISVMPFLFAFYEESPHAVTKPETPDRFFVRNPRPNARDYLKQYRLQLLFGHWY